MPRESGRKGARRSWPLAGEWAAGLFLLAAAAGGSPPSWSQWGRDPEHTSAALVAGQPLAAILADFVYDPFAAAEIAEGGSLFVHYAAPLVDGGDLYVEFKSGEYVAEQRSSAGRRRSNLFARSPPERAWRSRVLLVSSSDPRCLIGPAGKMLG